MKELAALFAETGCQEPRTYIQSGNIVFRTDVKQIPALTKRITDEIRARYGFATEIIIRSGSDLAKILKANPFLKEQIPESFLHVYFVAGKYDKKAVADLDVHRSPPDRFIVQGSEIYLCVPNGMGKTKLLNTYFEKKLGTCMTARNWRTVLRLYEMTQV